MVVRGGAVVDKVNELGRVEGSIIEEFSLLGLVEVSEGRSSCVELRLSPSACCLGAIEGLWRGPMGGSLCGAPSGSSPVSCLRLLAEGRVVISRQVEGEGTVAHTT